jgi:hypothetical protein
MCVACPVIFRKFRVDFEYVLLLGLPDEMGTLHFPSTKQEYQPSDRDFRFALSKSVNFILRNFRFYVLLAKKQAYIAFSSRLRSFNDLKPSGYFTYHLV